MAAASEKRVFDKISADSDSSGTLSKKFKGAGDEAKLHEFLDWCANERLILNSKVTVTREGSCAQYGMVATSDISEGDVLFEIPRSMLLHSETCSISELLAQESSQIQSTSGWVPLLLALMHESSNSNSRWRPYLDLVPNFDDLDLPMFWSSEELEDELKGTGVPESVRHDLNALTKEFNEIVLPFIKKHSSVFKPVCQELEFYKKMVAFVMSYSFTDRSTETKEDDDDDDDDGDEVGKQSEQVQSPPMMVPMADILNHVSKNNAYLVFGKDSLKMVAKTAINQGEEVYNTYGCNSNASLLQMYGFAETYPDNLFETVEFSSSYVLGACCDSEATASELDLLRLKWKFLEEQGLVGEGETFILDLSGFPEEEFVHTIKVLMMTAEEFSIHCENEGWDEEEEDNPEESLSFDNMKSLPTRWKLLFQRLVKALLARYRMTVEDEEAYRRSWNGTQTTRQKFSSHVRHGQMMLLTRALNNVQ